MLSWLAPSSSTISIGGPRTFLWPRVCVLPRPELCDIPNGALWTPIAGALLILASLVVR